MGDKTCCFFGYGKLPKENIEGAVRLSFSGMNTEDEALRFIEAIKEIIPKIKY